MFSSFYSIFLCNISTRFWMRKWRNTCSNAEVKSFAFTLDFGSHLLLSCPAINFQLYHIIWFILNNDVRITSYPERLLLKPFLGLLPSWDIPSALAHHHLEEGQKSIDNIIIIILSRYHNIILLGSTYFLFLLCIFSINFEMWKCIPTESLASLPIYKLGNSVTQIWHPSQLLIPSVLAYSSATCPKAKCRSNPKQCFCFWWNVGLLTGLAISL